MFVLGLTGSIGMGKSSTAAIFRAAGIPVHDADATVHALYEGAAAPLIEAAFPGTVTGGVVDRAALAARVLNDAAAIKQLEAIVHPLVRASRKAFVEEARARGERLSSSISRFSMRRAARRRPMPCFSSQRLKRCKRPASRRVRG